MCDSGIQISESLPFYGSQQIGTTGVILEYTHENPCHTTDLMHYANTLLVWSKGGDTINIFVWNESDRL